MKKIIFIPYQDVYDFSATKIMTREYSMLTILKEHLRTEELICVGKPRTFLDAHSYDMTNGFPESSKEYIIKNWIDDSLKIRFMQPFSFSQLIKKRGWWIEGYDKTLSLIKGEMAIDSLVYSNNPFAYKLLSHLKESGAYVFFDMMDNFAIHPSLRKSEREEAYKGYKRIFDFANFCSCNSEQSKHFCLSEYNKSVELIKNGVFHSDDHVSSALSKNQVQKIDDLKCKFRSVAGYAGKLGNRIDEKLLQKVSDSCKDTAFVFIGPMLKDQKNNNLASIIKNAENIVHLEPIPSCDVIPILKKFDFLIIPHCVGEKENGGDPLKLYQYLDTKKAVLSTGIIGVDEFLDIITISNDCDEWVNYIQNEMYKTKEKYSIPESIYWESRCKKLLENI